MPDGPLFVLTMVAALGSGLIAGVFFAFSTFVMRALARLPSQQGIAAMQSINVAAISPLFMTALFGTAAACVVLTIASVYMWHSPEAPWLLVGSLAYLVGTVLVTIIFSVPRNNALAAIAPVGSDAVNVWQTYLSTWTAWNHVRTVTALVAAALLLIALTMQRSPVTSAS